MQPSTPPIQLSRRFVTCYKINPYWVSVRIFSRARRSRTENRYREFGVFLLVGTL